MTDSFPKENLLAITICEVRLRAVVSDSCSHSQLTMDNGPASLRLAKPVTGVFGDLNAYGGTS